MGIEEVKNGLSSELGSKKGLTITIDEGANNVANILYSKLDNFESFLNRLESFSGNLNDEEKSTFNLLLEKVKATLIDEKSISVSESKILNKLVDSYLLYEPTIANIHRKMFGSDLISKIKAISNSNYITEMRSVYLEGGMSNEELREYCLLLPEANDFKEKVNIFLKSFNSLISKKVDYLIKKSTKKDISSIVDIIFDYYKEISSFIKSFYIGKDLEFNEIIKYYLGIPTKVLFFYHVYIKSIKAGRPDFIGLIKGYDVGYHSLMIDLEVFRINILPLISDQVIVNSTDVDRTFSEYDTLSEQELIESVIKKSLTKNNSSEFINYGGFGIGLDQIVCTNSSDKNLTIAHFYLCSLVNNEYTIKPYINDKTISQAELNRRITEVQVSNVLSIVPKLDFYISNFGKILVPNTFLDLSIVFPNIKLLERLVLIGLDKNLDKQECTITSSFEPISKISDIEEQTPNIEEVFDSPEIQIEVKDDLGVNNDNIKEKKKKNDIRVAWSKLSSANRPQIYGLFVRFFGQPLAKRGKGAHILFYSKYSKKKFGFSNHGNISLGLLKNCINNCGVDIVELAEVL